MTPSRRRTVGHSLVLLAAAVAPALLPAALRAQVVPVTGDSVRQDTLHRDSLAARAQRLERVTVLGTLSATGRAAPGAAVSVLTRSALKAEPMRLAVDPLRTATGVHIDQANGALGPTIIRLRGGEEQYTQVLVDGMAVNENGGFFDWHGLTLVNVDRVEIARGPQSTVYGSSAMSGAVRIVTRAGETGPMQGDVMVEGSRTSALGGGWRSTLGLRGGSDLLRYSIGAGVARERGVYALANDLKSSDGSLRLDWLPNASLGLTLNIRAMNAGSLLPVRDAGTTRAPLDPNQRQNRDRTVGSLEATWTPSVDWTHRLTVARYHLVFTYADTRDSLAALPFNLFNANYDYRAVLDRTTARYVGTVANSAGRALSYGAELENERLTNAASGDFGPSTQDIERSGGALFAEGQWAFSEAVSVLAGVRGQHYRGVGSAVVPRLAVTASLVPGALSARAGVGSAYAAPNIQVQYSDPGFFVGNPNLAPERSASVEAGLDWQHDAGTLSATVFAQRYDNLIRVVPYDSARFINANLGRIHASGLEVEGALRPVQGWRLSGTMSWLRTKVDDNRGLDPTVFPNDEALPFRPSYTGSAALVVPVLTPAQVTVRVVAVGPQTVITERYSGQRAPLAAYQFVNVSAMLPLTPSLDAYLHLENLFNQGYVVAYDRPGTPRSIAFGLRTRFAASR